MSVASDISRQTRAIGVETVGMTKAFGALTALDDVSIRVTPGSFHALLGENGAGKSTLVKCMMGFYQPTKGSMLVDERQVDVPNPRAAHALGIGMVYQHFTLVPSLTAAENLVIARADTPSVIDWKKERKALNAFLETTPFKVPLDVPANAAEFLPVAVEFANTKLLGTLGCAVLMDEDTKEAHQRVLDQAITDLRYGGIAVNTMPPFVFLSPYLTWGGNEEGQEFVSGHGNFGNLLCFENVEKSIITDSFTSAGHMMNTNKAGFDAFGESYARHALDPTWISLTRLMGGAVVGNLRKKDF